MLCALSLVSLGLLSAAPASALRPAKRPYDAVHYRLDVRLREGGAFENQARITLKPSRSLTTVELDAYGLSIQEVTVNQEKAKFSTRQDPATRTGLLIVQPAKALAGGVEATIEVRYTGKAGLTHEGFFTVPNTDGGEALPYFFTHFQTDRAQLFFPNNDQPADKASTEVFAVVDSRYEVLSNGARVLNETFTDQGEHLRRVHWRQEKPHSTYLVALAIGQFEAVTVASDVPATVWVPQGRMDRAFVAADFSGSALTFQERFLGVKYPWAKFDQVAVPRFIWGGMENTSLVLTRENGLVLDHQNHLYGRARITGLVAHELAHQWFGNLVTCNGWEDTWLNEGFATYLAELTEDHHYENDYVEVKRAVGTFVDYFRHEDGPRAHPLAGRSAADAFDAVSYQKGAHVLRMLETWLGREDFRKGLKAYLEQYALGNATSQDFFHAMGKATKKNLGAFKNAWLLKKGYPVIHPEYRYGDGKLTVTIRQKPNRAEEKGHFVFKLPIVIQRESEPSYRQEPLITVDQPVVTATFPVPAAPQWVNWNRDGAALARVHAPALGEQQWVQASRFEADPVWRLMSFLVLMDPLTNPRIADQAIPSDSAMGAILDGLTADPSPYVREAILNQLGASKRRRLPAELGPVVLALARRPGKLPEDALGLIRVRRAAMGALGKFDAPDIRSYLLEQIARPDLDLNYLPGLAVGTARLGDSAALASLRAAVRVQRARGYPFFRGAAQALGAVENPEVVAVIRDVVKEAHTNPELIRELLSQLHDNFTVKNSPEAAAWVQDFVVSPNHGEDLKARVLSLLDEVKTPHAQKVLVALAQSAGTERLKGSAQQLLAQNFPGEKGGKKAAIK